MPKISDIKQQVKRQDRYSVYVDEKYAFSLGETELLNTGLRIGQEFSTDELENLRQKAVLDKAYDRALNLIARRQRSRWELEDYLKRKDYDQDAIQIILNRLSERGYVNDKAFAEAWVSNRRLLKATSKLRLQQELRQKRVSDDIVQEVLEEDETNELDVLKELIERKRKQTRYQDDLKLMQYLVRQGYNYGDIKTALDELRQH
ncbi:MAG TPA: RecX family transcriptional regulator [Candidatus Saccharimonadales bacterium]|nr:RecX family transcriptional regulator [Candidatus Saccharimonadales bacterium]